MSDLRTTGAVGLALAVIAALVPWSIGPATAVAGPDKGATIAVSLDRAVFSPNGDGRKDTVHARFRLPAAARVTFLVQRPNGRVVMRDRLGPRARGWGSWVLDGRAPGGRTLRDGHYEVQVVAASGASRWHSPTRRVVVDTTVDIGVVRRDWPTVHPRTPGLVDTVTLEHLVSFWGDEPDDGGRFVIYGRHGDRVASWSKNEQDGVCDVIDLETYCGTGVEWDGRLEGRPLPAGTYTSVFTTRDPAGNVARRRMAIGVSPRPLVARRASVQVVPVEAVAPPAPYTGCNGCDEEIGSQCGTVTTPGRFGPGSLRYASRNTCDTSVTPIGRAQAAREHATAMVAAAAYGPRTVTTSGGPSVPGGADVAHLLVDGVDTTHVGDGELTSQELVSPRPGRTDRWVAWRFETRGTDSYDVAWFRLDYTYYEVP